MKKLLLLFTLAVIIVIACTEAKNGSGKEATLDLDEGRKAVDADNAKYMEEVKNGDTMALAEHYHPDGLIMPPNAEPLGKDEVAGMWGMFRRWGITGLEINTTDLVGQGDLMVETGTFELAAGDSTVDKGKYIVVWKEHEGKWKIYRDMINSNMPAAQAH